MTLRLINALARFHSNVYSMQVQNSIPMKSTLAISRINGNGVVASGDLKDRHWTFV